TVTQQGSYADAFRPQISRRDLLKRATALGLGIPVASGLIAACGGDDDTDPTSTEETAAQVDATPTDEPAAETDATPTDATEAESEPASTEQAATAEPGDSQGLSVDATGGVEMVKPDREALPRPQRLVLAGVLPTDTLDVNATSL